MTDRWLAVLPIEEASAIGILRLHSGIEVLTNSKQVWLRGTRFDEIDRLLRKVSGLERFTVIDEQRLVPVGKSVPTELVPEGTWTPIAQWFECELPQSCWPGTSRHEIPLRLIRSTNTSEANLLMTTFDVFERYVTTAPQIRLDHLTFAVNASRDVLIAGRPLPPLIGKFFVAKEGIAVQAGWRFHPPIDPATLKELFAGRHHASTSDHTRNPGELIVVYAPNGDWDFVPSTSFLRLTRSAVRLTAEALDA